MKSHEWAGIFAKIGCALVAVTAKQTRDKIDQKRQQHGGYGHLSTEDDLLSRVAQRANEHEHDAEEILSTLHDEVQSSSPRV